MITFENVNGGIGINAVYEVVRDSKRVAMLQRSGRSHWQMYSVHYGIQLAGANSIDEMRAKALTFDYPARNDVYEDLCQKAQVRRRRYAEQGDAQKLAELARQLIAGSNSARAEIEELVAEWDRFAADRSDTKTADMERVDALNKAAEAADPRFRYSGKWHYGRHAEYPFYPDPPK